MSEKESAQMFPGDGGSCTLLLLKTPPQLLVGLDMAQWRVGEKFRGIRNIHSGCHFLHWTESGDLQTPANAPPEPECTYTRMRMDEAIGSTGQRGEFLYFKEGQIIIREWFSSFSRFLPLSEDETLRYAAGVERQDFIHGLGVYPKHMRCQWRALTANISASCVSRVEPIGHCLEAQGMPLTDKEQAYIDAHTPAGNKDKLINAKRTSFKRADAAGFDEEGEDAAAPTQPAEEEEEEAKREAQDSAEAASCKMFYMDIRPARACAVRAAREAAAATRRSGGDAAAAAAAAAAAVTLQCTDRTDTLIQLAQENGEGWKAILGELQMAFIALVLGHHYPSFVHWKELVELLSSSERAVYLYPELFVKFIDAFYAQLEQAPDEITEGTLQEGGFLSSSCASLLETCWCIDRSAASRALQSALNSGTLTETGGEKRAVRDKEADAPSFAADGRAENAEAAAMRLKAMEPQYKEVEAAAGRLCDLVRLIFKVGGGGGEQRGISPLDEVLLALQGPDAPVVVGRTEAET